jgi:hypothetical protein
MPPHAGGEELNFDQDMFKNGAATRTPSRLQSRLAAGGSATRLSVNVSTASD